MRRVTTFLSTISMIAIPLLSLGGDTDTKSPKPLQQGGEQGIYQGGSLREVDQRLGMYLNGEFLKSILTPGETVDWKVNLKAGQVLVAEASSGSFDPGIEIVDGSGKVVAQNDDRFPGDQRPLVFWRCTIEGEYVLRARSFQNKAGGQLQARFKTYDTLDLSSGKMTDGIFDATKPFMVRVPMKSGQVMDIVTEKMGEDNYINFDFNAVIFPNGLPEHSPNLAETVHPAILALIAPLDGEYYLMYSPRGYRGGNGRVRMGTREFVPKTLEKRGNALVGEAPTNVPAIFAVDVKKGDLLEISTPELNLDCILKIAEAPKFAGFAIDPKKPELNPFYPLLRNMPPDEGEPLDFLPARPRDGRVNVFRASRDAKLWLTSNGAASDAKTVKSFTMRVQPAAADFVEGKSNVGKLKIAKHDYWSFDAKAGDVMNFSATTSHFNQVIVVRDPDLGELRHVESPLDQSSDHWRMVIQKPGRYLIQYSCLGNGGAGEYALSRTVVPAREFKVSSPAKGEIKEGEVQIWKFTANPKEPVFIHWSSSNWSYQLAVYNEKGQPSDFQQQEIDEHNRLGIIKVNEPRTYVIVLTGGKEKANYTIELTPVPAGMKGGG